MTERRLLRLGEPRAGRVLAPPGQYEGVWVIKKATHRTATIYLRSSVDVGPKYRGATYTYRWDGTGYARGRGRERSGEKRTPDYLFTDGVRPLLGR